MLGGASSTSRTVLAECIPVVKSNLLSMGLLPNVEMIESSRASSCFAVRGSHLLGLISAK